MSLLSRVPSNDDAGGGGGGAHDPECREAALAPAIWCRRGIYIDGPLPLPRRYLAPSLLR